MQKPIRFSAIRDGRAIRSLTTAGPSSHTRPNATSKFSSFSLGTATYRAIYIHAFIGGNAKALTRRLNLLSRKPNLYLARPHQQRESASANHRPLIYELDERGARSCASAEPWFHRRAITATSRTS